VIVQQRSRQPTVGYRRSIIQTRREMIPGLVPSSLRFMRPLKLLRASYSLLIRTQEKLPKQPVRHNLHRDSLRARKGRKGSDLNSGMKTLPAMRRIGTIDTIIQIIGLILLLEAALVPKPSLLTANDPSPRHETRMSTTFQTMGVTLLVVMARRHMVLPVVARHPKTRRTITARNTTDAAHLPAPNDKLRQCAKEAIRQHHSGDSDVQDCHLHEAAAAAPTVTETTTTNMRTRTTMTIGAPRAPRSSWKLPRMT
jgi:hypothetical protein